MKVQWQVIHIGAHLGEELETYRNMGMRHVILVEANPDVALAAE